MSVRAFAATETYSEDDITCAAVAIYQEAQTEPLRGARAVFDVILNRAKLTNRSLCEVITQPKQFSWYRKGMKFNSTKSMLTRLEAVRRLSPVVPNAYYFHNTGVTPKWSIKLREKTKIGKHYFYTKKLVG